MPIAAFGALAAVLVPLSLFAHSGMGPAVRVLRVPQVHLPTSLRWLGAWTWWDGAWYVGIAEDGYRFSPGRQSSVAFFPGYPLLMRAVGPVVGHPALAGFWITLASGLAAVALFHRWCLQRLDAKAAGTALAALLLYPCSFYLFGTVYADALFLAATLASFVLLEKDRPVLAGIAGAVATATRPIGMAVVVGLWLRARERQRSTDRAPGSDGKPRRWALPPGHAGLLIAPLGLVAYIVYLGVRFGHPFAFIEAEGAAGWGQAPGWRTWLKLAWFSRMQTRPYLSALHYHLVGGALVTLIGVLLLPGVFRRFGRAYGSYAALVLVGAAVSTRDFTGMGRYLLAAFPIFAVAGARMAGSPRLAMAALPVSALLLLLFTELHARNMLIS